ncbi:MAG: hypothetical protein ACHREM_03895 [Polyangiales bacterium]
MHPLAEKLRTLVNPTLEATNPASLRQALGALAMSVDFCAFEMAMLKFVLANNLLSEIERVVVAPRDFPTLGSETARQLAVAIQRSVAVFAAFRARHEINDLQLLESTDPSEIAGAKCELFLGDVLPAWVATMLLRHARGQVAIVTLLTVASDKSARVPLWIQIELGDIAERGSADGESLFVLEPVLDFANEARAHQRYKEAVFERLLRGEVIDADTVATTKTL